MKLFFVKSNDCSIVQDQFKEVDKQVEREKMLFAKEGLPKPCILT